MKMKQSLTSKVQTSFTPEELFNMEFQLNLIVAGAETYKKWGSNKGGNANAFFFNYIMKSIEILESQHPLVTIKPAEIAKACLSYAMEDFSKCAQQLDQFKSIGCYSKAF